VALLAAVPPEQAVGGRIKVKNELPRAGRINGCPVNDLSAAID
jgi:hypothetical protein